MKYSLYVCTNQVDVLLLNGMRVKSLLNICHDDSIVTIHFDWSSTGVDACGGGKLSRSFQHLSDNHRLG